MTEDAVALQAETLRSGYVGEGVVVRDFESRLEARFGRAAVAVNSATSGLHLALHMLRGKFREGYVLTTPLTCTATNHAILQAGFLPRWVDVEPDTLNIDLNDARDKVDKSVVAVVVVHWGGNPVNYKKLSLLQKHAIEKTGRTVHVVEDCAHAWGATYAGRFVGSGSNTAVFSFQAVKPLTTVDGGVVLTPDWRRARKLRWYGIDRDDRSAPVTEAGFKYHMNDASAALGLGNWNRADENVTAHRDNAYFYQSWLADFYPARRVKYGKGSSSYLYTLLVERREDFVAAMAERSVEVSPVHLRNDEQPCMAEFRVPLPALDKICDKIVCIPVGWWLSKKDRSHVVNSILKGW